MNQWLAMSSLVLNPFDRMYLASIPWLTHRHLWVDSLKVNLRDVLIGTDTDPEIGMLCLGKNRIGKPGEVRDSEPFVVKNSEPIFNQGTVLFKPVRKRPPLLWTPG